jgi:hypothetical protein
MLYLITPTGNRFLQFQLCVEMMANQTYDDKITWIIADDGQKHVETPIIKDWDIIHIKRNYHPGNTQGANLATALKACDPNGKILIIEDDDFYSPQWIEIMSKQLSYSNMCGQIKHKYYNIQNKTYKQFNNNKHAGLCCTGIRGLEAYTLFMNISNQRPKFIDVHLWHNFKGIKQLFIGNYVIGIKGMPGRNGIGMGHRGLSHKDDNQCNTLRKWVGDVWAEKYIGIYS